MNYRILQGDALAMLRTLPDESVHCGVTSPPYFGLRDYGTAEWDGGDPDCDHKPGNESRVGRTGLQGGTKTAGHKAEGYGLTCGKCGAVRVDNQIGLEPTPEEYVQRIVDVFREFRRVLRSDGTLFVNIGDSYARAGGTDRKQSATATIGSTVNTLAQMPCRDQTVPNGLKEKDLIGIPWMLAFALRADGWYLRSEIIWAKKSPMPESVTDRCTKAHEQVFMLTKSPRYFFDAQAIAEPSIYPDDNRKERSNVDQKRMPTAEIAGIRPGSATYATRNKRSVWSLGPEPTPYAHFATCPRPWLSRASWPARRRVAFARSAARRGRG